MKIAAVLLAVLGHVYARPGYGIPTKYEPSQDIHVQPLSQEADTASLPVSSDLSEDSTNARMYYEGDMIPVKLIYELSLGSDETPAVVKQVSLESLTGVKKPSIKISNRVARSHDESESSDSGNTIPFADYGRTGDSPSHEMYDDNFGGEHDSQEGKIPDGSFRSQHLTFDSDAYNRALGGVAQPPLTDNQSGVVRTIQRYQSIVLPSSVGTTKATLPLESLPRYLQPNSRSFDSFPSGTAAISNPYGGVWSVYTNIVEYGRQGGNVRTKRDVQGQKRTSKKKRTEHKTETSNYEQEQEQEQERLPGYQSFFADDLSRGDSSGPRIMRLKVRRGGVAIAGPGGIATAGSGGTAIVGPGGTAYTTRDGTAVVGPGGRVIQVPNNFQTTKIEARANDPNYFFIPPGGKVLGNGPFVYYGAQHQHSEPSQIERL